MDKPHETITGKFIKTGIRSSNRHGGAVAIRVDMTGREVGVLSMEDAIYVQSVDLPVLIKRLQEVESTLRAEGLLK
jgi:hypothetical protein